MNSNPQNNAIVAFAVKVLGVDLNRHQVRLLEAVMRHRRVAIASCHATGKTFSLGCLALGFASLYRDSRVIIVSPGWINQKTILWSEIHTLVERAPNRLPIESSTMTSLTFSSKNMILGLSASDPGRLQGHHAKDILVIVDEAAAIDPSFWPSLEGTLASGNARLVVAGNPTVSSGAFFDCFTRNRSFFETIQVGAFDTPNFEGVTLEQLLRMKDPELDDNVRPYLTTRRWVRERYYEWWNGSVENSPLWASRVLGQFPASGSNTLFPLAALETALRPAEDRGGRIVVGVDVAGAGQDLTACTAVTDSGAILAVQTFSESDARGVVVNFLRQFRDRLRLVDVDSTGLGFYFAEHLRSQGYPVNGLNAGSSAKDKERFTNSKAERYFALRQRFLRNEVSGLDRDTLSELAAMAYVIEPSGRTAIEAKDSVKSILGRSPDRAESLMLAAGENYQPIVWTPAIAMPRGTPYVLPGDPRGDRNSDRAKGEIVAAVEDRNGGRSEFGKLHRNSALGRSLRWF